MMSELHRLADDGMMVGLIFEKFEEEVVSIGIVNI